jgi:DNA-binding transcriptional regulator LsrR (DeoR family)
MIDDERALAAAVARKHYLGGQSKTEIAKQLFLSRFKVARLLELAVEEKIVRFTIDLGGESHTGLAAELRSAFRLQHVVVVDDSAVDAPSDLYPKVGHEVVRLLAEIVREGDVVGISSSRTMMGLPSVDVEFAAATFVQTNGVLSRPDAIDIIDGIRKLTNASPGGRAHVFYSPLVAPDEAMWRRYQTQPDAQRAFAQFDRLDIAIAGIGVWSEGLSVSYDNLPREIAAEATTQGAVFEIMGVPIDSKGRTVDGAARRRIVAPDAEVLSNVPTRIGVVVGAERGEAVACAIRSGLINSLVTHRSLAERLLEVDPLGRNLGGGDE